MTSGTIFLIILILLVLWLVVTYNSLIQGKNRVAEGLSDIDVQLKRRYDLIPNLVETVKGYMTHEHDTLTQVAVARTAAMTANQNPKATLAEKEAAENQLSSTLKTLFAVSENYPDLKASQNFLDLQNELTDTENKIQAARRFYNGMVRDFNTKLQSFPTNLYGSMLHFTPYDFFQAEAAERQAVKVSFK